MCTLFAVGTVAAGETVVRQETVDSKLTALSASHGFQVKLQQGKQAKVTVKIDKRLESYLICDVKRGKLTLGFKNLPEDLLNQNTWSCKPTADVTVNDLNIFVCFQRGFRCMRRLVLRFG